MNYFESKLTAKQMKFPSTAIQKLFAECSNLSINLSDIVCGYIKDKETEDLYLNLGLEHQLDDAKKENLFNVLLGNDNNGCLESTIWLKGNSWLELKGKDWIYNVLPKIPAFLEIEKTSNVIYCNGDGWIEHHPKEDIIHYEFEEILGCGDQSVVWTFKNKELLFDIHLPTKHLPTEEEFYKIVKQEELTSFYFDTEVGRFIFESNEYKILEPSYYYVEKLKERYGDYDGISDRYVYLDSRWTHINKEIEDKLNESRSKGCS